MTNSTFHSNSESAFLTTNQPTIETVQVLETLHCFFSNNSSKALVYNLNGQFIEHSFKYENELRECNLDYSLNSLKRIDELLLNIKNSLPEFTKANIFSSNYSLNNDSIIKIISYYFGELIGRARDEAPIWYRNFAKKYSSEKVMTSESLSVEFDSKFDINDDSCDCFIPLEVVYQALLTPKYDGVWQSLTLFESAKSFISSTKLDNLNFENPLSKPSVMALAFDRQSEFSDLDEADLAYLQMMPPDWMDGDSLYEQMNQLATLYKTGKVIWAHVVQANKILWTEDEVHSCPAEILYDPTGRTPVSHLAEVAHELYSLKNTIPDTDNLEIIEYAKHITDETTRVIGFDIPNSITSLPLKSTSMFIWRLHLPNGVLQTSFPILISDETLEVTVLPAKFWDKDYYDEWIESSNFKADMYYSFRKLYESENPWKYSVKGLLPRKDELIRDIPNLANPVTHRYLVPQLIDNRFLEVFVNKKFDDEEGINLTKIIIFVVAFIVGLYIFS